jgi:hypothetical protein
MPNAPGSSSLHPTVTAFLSPRASASVRPDLTFGVKNVMALPLPERPSGFNLSSSCGGRWPLQAFGSLAGLGGGAVLGFQELSWARILSARSIKLMFTPYPRSPAGTAGHGAAVQSPDGNGGLGTRSRRARPSSGRIGHPGNPTRDRGGGTDPLVRVSLTAAGARWPPPAGNSFVIASLRARSPSLSTATRQPTRDLPSLRPGGRRH